MKKFLIVVDMQKDFIDGALGTAEAVTIVDGVCERIREFDGQIVVTFDTHSENYMATTEGKHLPVPHCIKGTDGWKLDEKVAKALEGREFVSVEKVTFGSVDLPDVIKELARGEEFTAEFVGLCTDICVISNALVLKANLPEAELYVNSALCAGVTPESHLAAIETMRSCQINVI